MRPRDRFSHQLDFKEITQVISCQTLQAKLFSGLWQFTLFAQNLHFGANKQLPLSGI